MLTQPHKPVEAISFTDGKIWKHHVELVPDGRSDNEPILFRWHFPRGTLDQHMSALELTIFLLPHMAAVTSYINYTAGEKATNEWLAMLVRLVMTPAAVLDDLVPWMTIRLEDTDFPTGKLLPSDAEPDCVVEMSLSVGLSQKAMPKSFVLGLT